MISVRLVAPSIACGLKRLMDGDAAVTQNAASPTAKLRNDVIALPDTMQDNRAERRLIELDRRTGSINPQLRLDASHSRDRRNSSSRGLADCSRLCS